MATYDEIMDGQDRRKILKAMAGAVFVKPYDEADEQITSIHATTTGLVIPTGYENVGMLRKSEAVAWAREIDTSDVESWGYGEPTRRDRVKDETTMKFIMQESKRSVLELYNDVDYSGVTPDVDGNLVLDKPATARGREWRAFVLSKDGDGDDAIYLFRALPNCQVTDMDEQKWGDDEEIAYGVTLTGYRDPDWGTALREIWAGPGLDAVGRGFTA